METIFVYVVYDERAYVDKDNASVLFVSENKKEAVRFAKENNGVVVKERSL